MRPPSGSSRLAKRIRQELGGRDRESIGGLELARNAYAAGSDEIKIALVGCGGRGTGAAADAMGNHTHSNIKLVAMADAFAAPIERAHQDLKGQFADKVDVPPDRRFVGLDASPDLQRRSHHGGEQDQHRDDFALVVPELPRAAEHRRRGLVSRPRSARAWARSSRPRTARRRRASARAYARASPHGGARARCRSADSAPTRPARARAAVAADRSADTRPAGIVQGVARAVAVDRGGVGIHSRVLEDDLQAGPEHDRRVDVLTLGQADVLELLTRADHL